NNSPKDNALHLDCCMQPVGNNFLVTCSESFTYTYQYEWLVNLFGKNNVFDVSKIEMSRMMCNVFSISETVVVSDKSFKRLNEWMENKNIKVEKINFREVSKLGGLFRCVTMPLIRK
ncbi:MAG: arginine deiminase family protein, partial [Bacteroidota bacterium]|nr:arginine deiminase family protein [Bacteroidota bacterium]